MLLLVLLHLAFCKRNLTRQQELDYERNCPKSSEPIVGHRILKIIRYFIPKVVKGEGILIRIGREGDGGYNMLNDFSNVSCAYSFGIGGEWSWDLEISKMGIFVNMFDPFSDRFLHTSDVKNPLLKFRNFGIAGEDKQAVLNSPRFKPQENLYTLEYLLKLDDNFDKTNMLLKIDVEGWEWDVLSNISSLILNKFSQIVLEFHWFEKITRTEEMFSSVLNSLEKLNRTHQLIWVNGHNNADYCVLGGVPIPSCMEATFVRRSGKTVFENYKEKNHRIDSRNNKSRAKLLLWWIYAAQDIDFDILDYPYKPEDSDFKNISTSNSQDL